LNLKEIADHLGIHYSTVSKADKCVGRKLIFQDLALNISKQ